MHIANVEQFLAQHNAADPLRPDPITFLEPRREPYRALLFQPRGTVHASHDRIGNADPVVAAAMYTALLQEAVALQSHFVLTPEYSVPWSVVDQIARAALRPPAGSLWALGFESISPDQLDTLRRALADQVDVRLLHEPLDAQQRVHKAFVDPLVYIFWARTQADVPVLCLLVQFKTVSCRDDDHVELRSLYLGHTIYRFRNTGPSVTLLGLICSDAFEFRDADVDANAENILLIHIQLNKTPANTVYSAYRSRFYAVASGNNAEILCLNWSAGVRIDGVAGLWNEIAGSAWYVSPRAGQVADADVNRLHHDGVYYSLLDKRWHGFYLNYSPHFVVIEKQPVFSAGPQVLAPRLAPHVVLRREWDERNNAWSDAIADDGFDTFVQAYPPLDRSLPEMRRKDPLAVERTIELLGGTDGTPSEWYSVRELRAFRVAEEESLRRVTVSQETNRQRLGVAFRRERARKAKVAIEIPGQPVEWPKGAEDLAGGFRYRWALAEPHCNVEPLQGNRGPATLVFLGDEPEQDALSGIYEKLSKALRLGAAQRRAAGTADADASFAGDRLCVLYRRGNVLQFHRPPGWASITEPAGDVEDDITRGTP